MLSRCSSYFVKLPLYSVSLVFDLTGAWYLRSPGSSQNLELPEFSCSEVPDKIVLSKGVQIIFLFYYFFFPEVVLLLYHITPAVRILWRRNHFESHGSIWTGMYLLDNHSFLSVVNSNIRNGFMVSTPASSHFIRFLFLIVFLFLDLFTFKKLIN